MNGSATTNQCGCCEGVESVTPLPVENRPGLSALAYRIGQHADFKEAMQAMLGRQPALRDLTTRAGDDPTLALVDAWAGVLDVLTFYQERIASEHYLRTATERRSILELARQIGYELRPGVAASTYLAFTLETAPGAPASATIPNSATIPIGTRAQSLPGQDEIPQTFETTEAIEARAVWNEMRARTSEPFIPGMRDRRLYLSGVDNNLNPGDALLLVGDERSRDEGNERWDFRRIKTLTLDRERNLTTVELDRPLGSLLPWVEPPENPEVYALRQRAAAFGYNAPDWHIMPEEVKAKYERLFPEVSLPEDRTADWPGLTLSLIKEVADPEQTLYLDALYPKIVPGSWVVVSNMEYAELYRVDAASDSARTGFTLSAKTTRLELGGEHLIGEFDDNVRDLVVFGQSELLKLAERPLTSDVAGREVLLANAVEGLKERQLIAVTGTDAATGNAVSEIATLERAETVAGTTRLVFEEPLLYRYVRESVRLNANVARATHGETKREVLGSGNGSKPFQRFELKQKPLTYVAAPTPSGARSTLDVHVGGVRWTEVPTLYQAPPDAEVYTTRLADDGTVTVQFGDGTHGARPPTGIENVRSEYRIGTGLDGLVKAGQISLLMTRPLGVRGVTNPLPSSGAADPERLNGARTNAPLTVLTLDRIVSLDDFEDFARAFTGIGKAQAARLWRGEETFVYLTVAGAAGQPVPPSSALYTNLRDALDASRYPASPVEVETYEALTFSLDASVLADSRYLPEEVLKAGRAALLNAFSFASRSFAQDVTAGEIMAVLQGVEGILAVDLNTLDGADALVHPRLRALPGRLERGRLRPAQLLTIDPDQITLTVRPA